MKILLTRFYKNLVIEEEKRTDDIEESTIQFGKWNEFSGRQKSFPFLETDGLIGNYLAMLIHMMCLSCSSMTK